MTTVPEAYEPPAGLRVTDPAARGGDGGGQAVIDGHRAAGRQIAGCGIRAGVGNVAAVTARAAPVRRT